MADDITVRVAKAVVKELNVGSAAGSFEFKFTAEQSYAWERELTDGELYVDVLIVADNNPMFEQESLGSWGNSVLIDVAIRKRLDANDQELTSEPVDAINELVKFTRQIGKYFAPKQTSQDGRRLADITEAVWEPTVQADRKSGSGTSFKGLYDPEAIQQNRYVGWVRLAFSVPE